MTQRRRRRRPGGAVRGGRSPGQAAPLAGGSGAAGPGTDGLGVARCRRRTKQSQTPPCPQVNGGPSGWSYLEWAGMDFSSEEAFRAGAAALMDNCLSIGLNTVIVQVRPSRRLYQHPCFRGAICTGVQGQGPRLRPAGRPHHRSTQPRPFAGSVVNPYRLRLLGEDAARTGGK